jgi:L-iditol 2-dehydrogenase
MRAAILQEIGKVEMVDLPDPSPGEGEVLVRVRSVGVCGSDIHYYKHGRIGPTQVVTEPIVLGHEPAGEIAAVGPGVTRVREGDRVAIEPAVSCGHCPRCIEGRQNLCPDVVFLGTPPYHGAYREYLVLPEANVERIPDTMDFDTAALLEPLAIGLHAANLAGVQPGDRVGIFGAGPIGLCTLLGALARGAAEVMITDRIEPRLAMARRLGATHTVNIDREPAIETARALTAALGLDCTLEAAGDPEALNDAAECVRRGGRMAIVGIPSGDTVTLPIHTIRRAELTIRNVRRSNRLLERSIDLVASGRMDVAPLATHRYTLDTVEDAFKLVDAYADGVVKAMVRV